MVSYTGSDNDLSNLGVKVATLPKGFGFGELSILSSTHKFRTASAVCKTSDSLLFVLHEKTYNQVLRRHHFRQQELSAAMESLVDIPLCEKHTVSQLAGIAYSLKSVNYPKKHEIVKMGSPITCAMLIRSGEVRICILRYNPTVSMI
jgi:hypothetical protein